MNTEFFLVSEEWSLDRTSAEVKETFPIPNRPAYNIVEFKIFISRKPLFYVVNVVLPSTMLSFLCK